MRKIYIVPNFSSAAWAIIAASVFDMLDGRIARLARATSQFGVEYDSLSDLLSFGVAPGILLNQWALDPYGRLGWLTSFLFVACSGLRLARFNVNTSLIPKNYFQGLPTPSAAGSVATFILFYKEVGWPYTTDIPAFILALGLSILMISTVRFPSLKEFHWGSRSSFAVLLIGILVMILVAIKPEVTLFLLLATYILISLLWNGVRRILGRKVQKETQWSVRV
jgi:CDP-diacylglycerol---serine O-phosphatidyltransferase